MAVGAVSATCAASAGGLCSSGQLGARRSEACHLPTAARPADAPSPSRSPLPSPSPSPSPSRQAPATLCLTILPLKVSRPDRILFAASIKSTDVVRPVTVRANVRSRRGAAARFTRCPAATRAVCEVNWLRSGHAVWMRILVTRRRSDHRAILRLTLVATGPNASPATATAIVVDFGDPSVTATPSPAPTVTVTATATVMPPPIQSPTSLTPLPSPTAEPITTHSISAPAAPPQLGDPATTASRTPATADPIGGTRITGPVAAAAVGLALLAILAITLTRRSRRKTSDAKARPGPSRPPQPK
jgi:hypothetical protein